MIVLYGQPVVNIANDPGFEFAILKWAGSYTEENPKRSNMEQKVKTPADIRNELKAEYLAEKDNLNLRQFVLEGPGVICEVDSPDYVLLFRGKDKPLLCVKKSNIAKPPIPDGCDHAMNPGDVVEFRVSGEYADFSRAIHLPQERPVSNGRSS